MLTFFILLLVVVAAASVLVYNSMQSTPTITKITVGTPSIPLETPKLDAVEVIVVDPVKVESAPKKVRKPRVKKTTIKKKKQ